MEFMHTCGIFKLKNNAKDPNKTSMTTVSPALLTRRRVWALAVPIILSNVSEPLVGYFDLLAAGHLETTIHASAVTLSASAYLVMMWTFGFLRLSTGGFSAQAYGAEDAVQLTAVYQRAAIIALILGGFCLLIQDPYFQLAEWIFAIREGSQQDLTREFFMVRVWGAPASLLLFVTFGWLVGLQEMRWIFVLQLALNLMNIALNMLFTFELGWGVAGIALASNISTYVILASSLVLVWRLGGLKKVANGRLFNPERFRALFSANADLMIRSLAIEGAFIYMLRMGNLRDEVFATANGIILRFHEIAAFGLDGFAMAVESLAGAAYGAGSVTAYRRALRLTTEAAIILALIWSAGFFIFGDQIINSLTNKEPIRQAAQSLLLFGALSPLIGVLSYQLDGVFFGLTQTRILMVSMLFSALVFVGSSHFGLVPAFGMVGLWWGYVIFMFSRTSTLLLALPYLDRQVQLRAEALRSAPQ